MTDLEESVGFLKLKRSNFALVCGGRAFLNHRTVARVLDRARESLDVVEIGTGGATGADRLAEEWARDRGVPFRVCPADWRKHGKAAGPIRNRLMLTLFEPDLVIAFPGGAGTADMVAAAKACGFPVFTIR